MKRFVGAFALVLCSCDQAPWQGWVYPNRSKLTDDIALGRFATLDQCRASAREILDRQNIFEDGEKIEGDYECGYKCKPDGGESGLNVCEKTER